MTTQFAAIVDPYSSGALLAPEFKKRGYECLMVQSSLEVPAIYRSSFNPDDFVAIIQHKASLDETMAQLQQWKVKLVIAGCELGVELADQLSERLGLLSNGTKLSAARRNKCLMMEAVRKHGLRTPAQFCSDRLDNLINWIHSHDDWPVILKPLHSSGSDGVSLCASEGEVRVAFENIMYRKNKLGLVNKAILVQEFLNGVEYAIDTVSCAGYHRVAAFWKYGKSASNSSFIGYDFELLPHNGELQHHLFAYITGVLDAVEIKFGPAHCEVMWVDGTPILMEIGSRLNGGNNPLISLECSGSSQIEMTVEAYLDSKQFFNNLERPYELPKRGMRAFLMPDRKGQLQALPRLSEIEELQSFHQMHIGAECNQPVPRIVGWVILVHSEQTVLDHDLQRIRYLEENGLYQIAELR